MMCEPVEIKISLDIWHRNHKALNDALDNALELLSDHDSGLGRTTKKNEAIAEMYEREIKELKSLITYSSNNNGAPF